MPKVDNRKFNRPTPQSAALAGRKRLDGTNPDDSPADPSVTVAVLMPQSWKDAIRAAVDADNDCKSPSQFIRRLIAAELGLKPID